MKVLPLIAGGNNSVRRPLLGLIGIAMTGVPLNFSDELTESIDRWEHAGRPSSTVLLNSTNSTVWNDRIGSVGELDLTKGCSSNRSDLSLGWDNRKLEAYAT